MAYDPGLAQRVREALGERHGVTEKAMFGGLAFLVDGRMFVGIQDATLMARVGPERHDDALAVAHVRQMDFTGRPMKGYVYVDPPGLMEDKDLQAWVHWCVDFVAAMPGQRNRPGQQSCAHPDSGVHQPPHQVGPQHRIANGKPDNKQAVNQAWQMGMADPAQEHGQQVERDHDPKEGIAWLVQTPEFHGMLRADRTGRFCSKWIVRFAVD